jgi:hypothetical protein
MQKARHKAGLFNFRELKAQYFATTGVGLNS